MAITIRKISCPEPPVGATLMKTGQTTSYRTGDDGDIEAGRDVDFFTLSANNPFGNTNRFTDELGGQTYTNNIVIDWSTYNGFEVLGYYRVIAGNNIWDFAIDTCLALNIGGFTGWKNANVYEIMNVQNFQVATHRFNYAPFNTTITTSHSLWASTTVAASTGNAIYFITSTGQMGTLNKTVAAAKYFAVRTFTVNGTTLT